MKSTPAQKGCGVRAILLASALSVAALQPWSQSLIGDGLAPTDDPGSPYYRKQIAPPSWQGRPYSIREDAGPGG